MIFVEVKLMKKILITLILLLAIGCTSGNISSISYKELNKKLDNKDTFIILFTEKDNEDAKTLRSTLSRVLIDNNIKEYELYTNKLSKEQITSLKMRINYDVPSIAFIIDGNDPSILSHVNDATITSKEIEARLKDMGFIE